MERWRRGGGYDVILERYSWCEVYDSDGGKIGKVDKLFLDESHQPEYLARRAHGLSRARGDGPYPVGCSPRKQGRAPHRGLG